MRYKITKRVADVCASHQLTSLPADHKCARMHGHNYTVEVSLSSLMLDNHGMVLDFDLISTIIKQYDHRNLNDFFIPSTAEMFAQHLWDEIERDVLSKVNSKGPTSKGAVRIESITVSETGNNAATLTRE